MLKTSKVEKILSPSVKIQIMFGKESLLEVQGQNIAGQCQQNFENKKIVNLTQQCFALLPQVYFSRQ